jgi:enoyl-CoA hydratase/carnithine racemase
MLMLGERYSAVELKRSGVAWRIVPDDRLMDEAIEVAGKLASLPPLSLHAMKRVLNQAGAANINLALDLETEATVAGFLDPETTRLLKDF